MPQCCKEEEGFRDILALLVHKLLDLGVGLEHGKEHFRRAMYLEALSKNRGCKAAAARDLDVERCNMYLWKDSKRKERQKRYG